MLSKVEVTGLKEFRKALRQFDTDLPKSVKVAGNAAAQIVVNEATPRVPVKSGKARKSIRVASTQKDVRVRAGGKKVQYYPWLDFGGRVGVNRSVRRPYMKTGRYIWRAFADNQAKVLDVYQQGLVDVAKNAGLEVKDGG